MLIVQNHMTDLQTAPDSAFAMLPGHPSISSGGCLQVFEVLRTFPTPNAAMADVIDYASMKLPEALCRQLIVLGQADDHSPVMLSLLLKVLVKSQKSRLKHE